MDLELVSLETPCPLDVDPAGQAGRGFQNRQRACNKYSSLTSATAKNKGGKKRKKNRRSQEYFKGRSISTLFLYCNY